MCGAQGADKSALVKHFVPYLGLQTTWIWRLDPVLLCFTWIPSLSSETASFAKHLHMITASKATTW